MDTIDFVLKKLSLRRIDHPPILTRGQIISIALKASLMLISGYLLVAGANCLIDNCHLFDNNHSKAKKLAQKQLKKLNESLKKSGGRQLKFGDLSDQELIIAAGLVTPEDIKVQWSDIAGLDGIVQELRETVVLPVQHRELFKVSPLWRAPMGVLLHGPPGCGKTLIAKAMAKEAGMRFINLDVATLTDKWYGETQKLAAAVFSLAKKLEPSIIFIDEIDSLLRARGHNDHEATAMMKTQFMRLWDGLITAGNSAVIVLGATNRPEDLDRAILRRMPAKFHIGMPDIGQRQQLLRLILKDEQLQASVDLAELAAQTDGFSGYDLKELCRHACMHRMRQFMRETLLTDGSKTLELSAANEESFKDCLDVQLHMEDLLESLSVMQKSRCTSSNKFTKAQAARAKRR
ncbi:LOW QUALITY PROTEIN: outer mitochondrial transmembrane helix translocase [Drosophila obscura]|uniref:LOW QUALITY PROTEIN: outer mitochondrial transmembrane helix translocase n=1 Tax=Drosophila obscura TaxID=7282 RepID=UPI001BB1E26B|nr:LOW QUALITY PROTEIN: outer mitochondrial transmembrane helix translocase [Drosophila obscura]